MSDVAYAAYVVDKLFRLRASIIYYLLPEESPILFYLLDYFLGGLMKAYTS